MDVCESALRTLQSRCSHDRYVPEVGSGPLTPTMQLICSTYVFCQSASRRRDVAAENYHAVHRQPHCRPLCHNSPCRRFNRYPGARPVCSRAPLLPLKWLIGGIASLAWSEASAVNGTNCRAGEIWLSRIGNAALASAEPLRGMGIISMIIGCINAGGVI
jgi:hypothetical protein